MKNSYTYVLKSIKKDKSLTPFLTDLSNKNYIVAGGTRGIGFNIAEKLALNNANVTILGKTKIEHPKLENTIFTAAEKLLKKTKQNNVMPISCDIRGVNDQDLKETNSRKVLPKTLLNLSLEADRTFVY